MSPETATPSGIVDELLYIVTEDSVSRRRAALKALYKEHSADAIMEKARYVKWYETLVIVNTRLLELTLKQRKALGYTVGNVELETRIAEHHAYASRITRLFKLEQRDAGMRRDREALP